MAQTIVTHGVIRVTGTGVAIDGKTSNIAYVMPPMPVVVEGVDVVIDPCGALEVCDVAELKAIKTWLGVSSSARTEKGLIAAIDKHILAEYEAGNV